MSSDGILRIVVGVDLTEAGDRAIDEAVRYAARLADDELHAVFVISDEDGRRHLERIDAALREASESLRRRVVDRCEAHGVPWDQAMVFHVRIGNPAAVIHQVAVDVEADLIVVGTHARTGLPKLILGSVAEELVRTARAPVLVARANELGALPKTPAPDPARPGADLHAQRAMSNEHLSFGRKRDSHISGLV